MAISGYHFTVVGILLLVSSATAGCSSGPTAIGASTASGSTEFPVADYHRDRCSLWELDFPVKATGFAEEPLPAGLRLWTYGPAGSLGRLTLLATQCAPTDAQVGESGVSVAIFVLLHVVNDSDVRGSVPLAIYATDERTVADLALIGLEHYVEDAVVEMQETVMSQVAYLSMTEPFLYEVAISKDDARPAGDKRATVWVPDLFLAHIEVTLEVALGPAVEQTGVAHAEGPPHLIPPGPFFRPYPGSASVREDGWLEISTSG